jgi:16S rRNA (cytosine967-C5)-methyltransferase
VTKTSAFREARIQIQDEGSQVVAMLASRGDRLLDCCAAPGGKTAIMAERNPQSEIVATELHEHRARALQERLKGRVNVTVITADVTNWSQAGDFDRVLADVPCSGTGTLARNPEIKWRLTPADIADLHRRQVAILRAALGKLRPGGRLVYSTCSLETEENEAVIREAPCKVLPIIEGLHALRSEGELLIEEVASLTDGPFLRLMPGQFGTDGFFAAILTK